MGHLRACHGFIELGRVDLLLLPEHLRCQVLGIRDTGVAKSPDHAIQEDRTRAIEEGAEDLTQPGTREREGPIERLSMKPLSEIEDAETHVSALVTGDELDDPT